MSSRLRSRSSSQLAGNQQGLRRLLYLGVFVCTVAPFYEAALGSFEWQLHWDDRENYIDNTAVHVWSRENVKWAWREGVVIGVWEPAANMIKMAFFTAFGVSSRAFHMMMLLLHGLNTALLFGVSTRIVGLCRKAEVPVGDLAGCALGAILFGVHPLRAEVVCWASCQPYLLAALFSLASVHCHLQRRLSDPNDGNYWLLCENLALAAAVLSKTAAVPVCGVLIYLDAALLLESPSSVSGIATLSSLAVKANVPVIGVAALGVYSALSANATGVHHEQLSALGCAMRVPVSLFWYLRMTIWPDGLSNLYPYPRKGVEILAPEFLLPASLTVGGAALLIDSLVRHSCARSSPHFGLTFFTVVFVGLLSPTLIGVQHGYLITAADRYNYIPSMAIAPACAALWRRACGNGGTRRGAVTAVVAAVVVGLGRQTLNECSKWRTSETLWSHAVASRPDDPMAWNVLGQGLLEAGRHEEAIPYFENALRQDKYYFKAYGNLGVARNLAGRPLDAVRAAVDGIAVVPGQAEVFYHNMAFFLSGGGGGGGAVLSAAETARLYREAADADSNPIRALQRGVELLSELHADALGESAALLDLIARAPSGTSADAFNAGVAWKRAGDRHRAMDAYRLATSRDPQSVEPQANLGGLLLAVGDTANARSAFESAIAIDDNSPQAWYGLGNVEISDGDVKSAVKAFRKAVSAEPSPGNPAHKKLRELGGGID